MWVKTAAVLLAMIPLMGSKIVIEVPEGGSVVSSSGLVTCSAHETCTIDTTDHPFAETFTAVAEPGYEFIAWEDGAAAVCGGSQSEDCSELDDEAFSEFRLFAEPSDAGGARTMSPTFTAAQSDEVESAPRFNVSSFHSTRYYEVQGKTQQEVWEALHGADNPLILNAKTGRKPAGFASFTVRYSYESAYDNDSSDCSVAAGDIEFAFETTLPRLAEPGQNGSDLEQRWQRFQNEIIEHEAGHIALYRQLVTELPEVIRAVSGVPCSELGERVRVVVAESVHAIKQANEEYDRSVGDGIDLADARTH